MKIKAGDLAPYWDNTLSEEGEQKVVSLSKLVPEGWSGRCSSGCLARELKEQGRDSLLPESRIK